MARRRGAEISQLPVSPFSTGRRMLGLVGRSMRWRRLAGVVLLLFELVLIARMVVDWIGVLSRTAAAAVSTRHAGLPTASPSP